MQTRATDKSLPFRYLSDLLLSAYMAAQCFGESF